MKIILQNKTKQTLYLFAAILESILLFSCNAELIQNQTSTIFETDTLLHFTLSAPFEILHKDVDEKRFYHKGSLLLQSEKDTTQIEVAIKTRGHFRRDSNICDIMPLKLKFKKKEVKNTYFDKQTTLKLVLPCSYDSVSQQLLIREYLIYKIYQLFTPLSYRVQLCNINLVDCNTHFVKQNVPAFFIENTKKMGQRNKGKIHNTPYRRYSEINDYTIGLVSIFQYMIGNNDWSVYYLHNIKLLYEHEHSPPYTIPYDFDMSEVVDAPYATANTHEAKQTAGKYLESGRSYMGNSRSEEELEYLFGIFAEKKDAIYATINNCKLLTPNSKTHCRNYIDQFYYLMANDSLVKVFR